MKLINLQKQIEEIIQNNPFALNAEVCVQVHGTDIIHVVGTTPTVRVDRIKYESESVVIETNRTLTVKK